MTDSVVFSSPVKPKRGLMHSLSNSDSFKKAFAWLLTSGQTMRWATEEVVLEDVLKGVTCQSSVDIGCGGGHYLLGLLVPRSVYATGIDYDEGLVRMAARRITRSNSSSRVSVMKGSVDGIPLASESIDLVLCTQVLEHVPDVTKGIGEIHRILRRGGKAVLAIPIQPDPYPNPGHVQVDLAPAALDTLVTKAGFEIVDRRTCMFVITRAIFWLTASLRIPLPLVPVCRLEQATAGLVSWPRPYCYICVAIRK